MENEKSCQSCKYFKKHYVIVNNKYLRSTRCGHCTHDKMRTNIPYKKLFDGAPCNYFEPLEAGEEAQDGICEAFKKIQKELRDIKLILSKD